MNKLQEQLDKAMWHIEREEYKKALEILKQLHKEQYWDSCL